MARALQAALCDTHVGCGCRGIKTGDVGSSNEAPVRPPAVVQIVYRDVHPWS